MSANVVMLEIHQAFGTWFIEKHVENRFKLYAENVNLGKSLSTAANYFDME
jgi:hypothetical protein